MLPITLYISNTPVCYKEALSFMEQQVNKIYEGSHNNSIWFLEHPPIYTKGSSSNDNEPILRSDIPVYHSNGRGGKMTYHGPGQRVIYLMLNLQQLHNNAPDLKKFVRDVESWLINSFQHIGVQTYTKPGLVGIWTKYSQQEQKIAAIGLRVKKWVTSHGVSINVHPDMSNFSGIIPCGIKEYGVTSLNDMGMDISLLEFDKILLAYLLSSLHIEVQHVQII